MQIKTKLSKYYKGFSIALKLRGKLVGGQPKNPDVLGEHLRRKGFTNEEIEREIAEKNIEKEQEKNWMGFERDGDKLCIRGYQIKGLLKEVAKLFNYTSSNRGLKGTLQKIKIKPRKISLDKSKPDGIIEKAGTVIGPQGARSIITKGDYVKNVEIVFETWIPNNLKINDKMIRELFEIGQEIGLGSMRNFDYGEYDLVKIERIDK